PALRRCGRAARWWSSLGRFLRWAGPRPMYSQVEGVEAGEHLLDPRPLKALLDEHHADRLLGHPEGQQCADGARVAGPQVVEEADLLLEHLVEQAPHQLGRLHVGRIAHWGGSFPAGAAAGAPAWASNSR